MGATRLMSVRLPQANGGRAEEVLGLLKLRIDQYVAAGLAAARENKARENVSLGEADLAAGRFVRPMRTCAWLTTFWPPPTN